MSRAPQAINTTPALRQQGAQPFGTMPDPIDGTITTLTGASALPARPTGSPPGPAFFRFTFAGALTGNSTITLPVTGWVPGDYVRILLQPATVAAYTLRATDGGGTTNLATLPATLTTSGHIDVQLNAASTHWTLLAAGGA